MNEENIANMNCSCKCDCSNWFDLEDGYGCYSCNKTVCPECMADDIKETCNDCSGKKNE